MRHALRILPLPPQVAGEFAFFIPMASRYMVNAQWIGWDDFLLEKNDRPWMIQQHRAVQALCDM